MNRKNLVGVYTGRFIKSIKRCLVLTCNKFSNLIYNKNIRNNNSIKTNKNKTILYYKRNRGLMPLCLFVM